MSSNGPKSKKLKFRKVFEIDQYVCNFIASEFLEAGSNRFVGDTMNKSESIVRKFKDEYGYNVPLSTINAFCVSQKITLSQFFKLLEEKYGDTISDSFKIIEVDRQN